MDSLVKADMAERAKERAIPAAESSPNLLHHHAVPISKSVSISTLLFYLGLIAIPFDNLFFAPSGGWATIAPIIFALYVCFNASKLVRLRFDSGLFLAFLLLVSLPIINLFIYGITLDALFDGLATFALGIFFYLALLIRYDSEKASFNRDGRILFGAYVAAFAYGIIRMAAAIWMPELYDLFLMFERRPYTRLAFSFTEPSFITLHVFGVLFLYTYFVSDRKLARKMIILGFLFLGLAIITNSSSRCMVDTAAFLFLLLLSITLRDRKHSARNFAIWALVIGALAFFVLSSTRIQNILIGGLSNDGSSASRLFRIEAMVNGFLADPLAALFGYGQGNMIIPFREGYDQAFIGYTNSYMTEVNWLGTVESIDNITSMPIRLVSDIGLLAFIGLTFLMFYAARKKGIDPCVVIMTLWLYVQFDSYAFYALWLLLYLFRAYDPEKMGVSYFVLPRRKRKAGKEIVQAGDFHYAR